jgi:hypothetical protein
MVTVKCDVCGAEWQRGEEWILGHDLAAETPTSVQRAIRFLDHWDGRRVLELGSLHLCSEECRDDYLRRARVA